MTYFVANRRRRHGTATFDTWRRVSRTKFHRRELILVNRFQRLAVCQQLENTDVL